MPDLTEEELQAAAQAEAAGIPGYEQVAGVPVPLPTDAVVPPQAEGPTSPLGPPVNGGITALEASYPFIQQAVAPRPHGPVTQVRTTATERMVEPLDPAAVAAANAQARASQDAANEEAMQLAIVQGRPYMYGGQALDQMAENRAAAQQQADAQQAEIFEREANVQRQVSGLLDQARSPVVRGALFDGPGGGGRAISMGIGMLFSGLRGLATGNPNAALEFVNNVVERNLQDQIRERDNAYQNAEARNSLFSMAERELGSREAATAVTRAAMYDYAIEKMRSRISANTPKELQLQVEAQIAALEAQRDQAVAQGVAQSATRTTERQIRRLPGGPGLPSRQILLQAGVAAGNAVSRDQSNRVAEARVPGQRRPIQIAHGELGPAAMASQNSLNTTVQRIEAIESLAQDVERLRNLRRRWVELENGPGLAPVRLTDEGRQIIATAERIHGSIMGRANSGIYKFGAMNQVEAEIAGSLTPNIAPTFWSTRGSTIDAGLDNLREMINQEYVSMERSGTFRRRRQRENSQVNSTVGAPNQANTTSVPVIPE